MNLITVILISLIIIITLLIGIYDYLVTRGKLKLNNLIYKQQVEYYETQYSLIKKSQEETRKFKHELKNIYLSLELLAKEKKYDELLSELHTLQNITSNEIFLCNSGNLLIDGILNNKLASSDLSIKYNLNISVPTELELNSSKLCGILGNAIDNAIDAILYLEEEKRTITINMYIDKRNLFIEIINPFSGILLPDSNGLLKTTKSNKSNHGFGFGVITSLLSNNFGSMDICQEDNLFHLRIIIYHVL